MKTVGTLIIILFLSAYSHAQINSKEWPVLKKYNKEHIQRIAMPVGGIGTGTVSLTGYGALTDWEIMSRPAKGYNPQIGRVEAIKRAPFFAIYVKEEGHEAQTVLLEGPLPELYSEGYYGATGPNHGLPRFAEATFQSAYPFGQVLLKDKDMPVQVTVGAFNPLIPGNVEKSSIPLAILSYKVKNTSDKPLTISLAGTIPNFIGCDGFEGKASKNVNTFIEENGLRGIHYTSDGVDKESAQWGSFSLATNSEDELTYRTNWVPGEWGNSTLEFWDDYTADGLLEERSAYATDNPVGSLAVKTSLAPNEEKEIRFFITWIFPNRPNWSYQGNVGNYYATQYEDSWDVLNQTIKKLPELESKTSEFVNSFIDSDIPPVIKEGALFNLAHLRTQLVFRTKAGYFFGWEGTDNERGRGSGSCTHVWNYEQVTPFLFGEMAQNMREVEFAYGTDENGLMSFRIHLPLAENAQQFGIAAADGQMGCIMKYYREWQLSGDDEFLIKHWPNVKKSLEFCWIPGGWDADKDGVMEGAQHNTMDVDYFGPNPQMGFWYLGALRAAEEMSTYLGEKDFASTCRSLYKKGSAWMDEHLFNGEYYEQQIVPPLSEDHIAKGLIRVKRRLDVNDPQYQIGKGVLVDQLVGQVMAHILDLGYLADKENIQETNNAIIKYNHRESLLKHPNFMRSYALGNESALLMAAYPGERPRQPFPYFTEVMTGFEHTAAVGMIYENQLDNGLKTIADIRARYDGKKRNPFNEAEFGNHYARAMMSWAGAIAWTGFHYSAVDQSMSFTDKDGTYFWSNGYQYGTIEIATKDGQKSAALTVLNGSIELRSFKLKGYNEVKFKKGKTFRENEMVVLEIDKSNSKSL